MSHYLYLILGTIFLFLAVVIAIIRPDLRRVILFVALAGAAWGPVSEVWFYRDYWHPEYILGSPLIEDLIYGAGISAAAAVAFKVLARKTNNTISPHRTQYLKLIGMVILYIVAMIIFEMILHVNSIVVAIGTYVVIATYILTRRRDLWLASALSAVIMGLTALFGYAIGLDLLVPEPATLAQIWLLYGKPMGVTVLGYVPLTEVVWYAAWGLLLGILYEFVTGSRLVPLANGGSTATGPARPSPASATSQGPDHRVPNDILRVASAFTRRP